MGIRHRRTSWRATVMQLETCPDQLLPRLASFTGVQLKPGADADEARRAIEETEGFQRGTRAGLLSDVQQTLTGTKTVTILERFGGNAWTTVVRTRVSETPDTAATCRRSRRLPPPRLPGVPDRAC